MTVTVTPMSPACGAEISDIDLRKPLADDDLLAIRQAWLDHLVIVFRGQDLTPADQKRACGHFGEIGEYNRPKDRQHPKHARDEIMLISNIREEGRPIGAHPDDLEYACAGTLIRHAHEGGDRVFHGGMMEAHSPQRQFSDFS